MGLVPSVVGDDAGCDDISCYSFAKLTHIKGMHSADYINFAQNKNSLTFELWLHEVPSLILTV